MERHAVWLIEQHTRYGGDLTHKAVVALMVAGNQQYGEIMSMPFHEIFRLAADATELYSKSRGVVR